LTENPGQMDLVWGADFNGYSGPAAYTADWWKVPKNDIQSGNQFLRRSFIVPTDGYDVFAGQNFVRVVSFYLTVQYLNIDSQAIQQFTISHVVFCHCQYVFQSI
jgi:hypothetical protein